MDHQVTPALLITFTCSLLFLAPTQSWKNSVTWRRSRSSWTRLCWRWRPTLPRCSSDWNRSSARNPMTVRWVSLLLMPERDGEGMKALFCTVAYNIDCELQSHFKLRLLKRQQQQRKCPFSMAWMMDTEHSVNLRSSSYRSLNKTHFSVAHQQPPSKNRVHCASGGGGGGGRKGKSPYGRTTCSFFCVHLTQSNEPDSAATQLFVR